MSDGKRPKDKKLIPPASLGFEDFVRAAMQTGKPPAQKKKAAKRRSKKQKPRLVGRG